MTLLRAALLSTLALCAGPACSASDGRQADAADGGAPDASADDAGPGALHVLFIGNSYTYVNDLPGMLANIAATSGTAPTITTDEVVQGGATLENHWSNGVAQAKIMQGQWTHVVLQGQSLEPLDTLPGPGSTFSDYAEKFADLIVQNGAKPALFATWARASGDGIYAPLPYGAFACPAQMQDELTIAYASVARARPESILVCAGEAFKRSLAQYPGIVLQQGDHSHPTVAGTYLAASTFYVALTGKPVPEHAAVPPGLSAQDAANLRDIARVGSACADVRLQGAISSSFAGYPPGGDPPFDFGTAGLPISTQFELKNTGGMTVGITDGMTLAPPFVWTAGGAYPGGSGSNTCTSSLSPGSSCTISITFTGASSATGALTLDFTNAYLPSATRALRGAATQRALVSVSDSPGFFGCTDATCGPSTVSADTGVAAPLTLFVMNRGAVPVTSLGAGTPQSPPFVWAGGAYPGGSGTITWGAPPTSYPYCSSGTLGVGEQCVVTIDFSPVATGKFTGVLDLAYSDAMGAVLPNASRRIEGDCSNLPP